jgi:mannosyltransferase OCH1-like enzyme
MIIPKIIHQTWKNEDIPEYLRNLVSSWKELHPGWRYILWTDEMNIDFIKKYFPDFLDQYNNYDFQIQKVDAVRYFILYQFGGVFIDLDFECYRNVETLLCNTDCALGMESSEQCSLHGKELIISNAFMASIPKAGFMKILCEELNKPILQYNNKNDTILESTGPFMVTRIYQKYGFKFPRLKILEAKKLYPLSQFEIETFMLRDTNNGRIRLKLQEAFAVHHYWGSWWK